MGWMALSINTLGELFSATCIKSRISRELHRSLPGFDDLSRAIDGFTAMGSGRDPSDREPAHLLLHVSNEEKTAMSG